MTLLYAQEHKSCFNYESSDQPMIEIINYAKDDPLHYIAIKSTLVFLVKGQATVSYGPHKNKSMTEHRLILIPPGNNVDGHFVEDSTAFIIRMRSPRNLCECFSLDMLLKEEDNSSNKTLYLLDTHRKIVLYFEGLRVSLEDQLLCKYYLELKKKELFYLLRAYHTKEDLLEFFWPLLSNDMTFSDFVIRNHFKVKTVRELAELANYSLSGFQKRFKKVFEVSAYNWMKEEKIKLIFHDINNSTLSFKELSENYGFSSPSHFNDFCKINFGYTPGVLRKKKVNLRLIRG